MPTIAHPDLDPRIAEAMQAIGSIVENDLGVPYEPIAQALTALAGFTRSIGQARAARLTGDLVSATLAERRADAFYSSLPGSALW